MKKILSFLLCLIIISGTFVIFGSCKSSEDKGETGYVTATREIEASEKECIL